MDPETTAQSFGDGIAALVELAARQDNLSGIRNVLGHIGGTLDACVCILWQATPTGTNGAMRPDDYLHVVADWSRDRSEYTAHDLPFQSVTGSAIDHQCKWVVAATANAEGVHKSCSAQFFLDHKVQSFCTVPLQFVDKVPGALNIYRSDALFFTRDEIARAQQFAKVLPTLYHSIWEKSAFVLIQNVRDVIQHAELDLKVQPQNAIETLCRTVADHFSAIECSILLEDKTSLPGEYKLHATTCPEYIRKQTYTVADEGITAWVIRNKGSVQVPDLAHFARDRGLIHRRYEGLTWEDKVKIESATRKCLKKGPKDRLPPFSFMAVPIMVGAEIVGVIRCCTAQRVPFYFSDRETALLSLVASQIGHFWKSWLVLRQTTKELDYWHEFGKAILKWNKIALTELSGKSPEVAPIWQAGLKIAATVIPGADILDIRRYDPTRNDLYFDPDLTEGAAWRQGNRKQIKERLDRRFPIQEGAADECMGSIVYRTGETQTIPDTSGPHYSGTFPDVRRMIVAPIRSHLRKYGVLDVRGAGNSPFPMQAEAMATLIGQQLGMYESLIEIQKELSKTIKVQTQSYEDLEHQLRSTVRQARDRVSSLLRGEIPDDRRQYVLNAVRGLIGKAHSVVRSIGMFHILHDGRELPIRPTLLTADGFIKTLIAVCADNAILFDYGVRARVDAESFAALRDFDVSADTDLMDQALQNVIDNAFKYSQPKTTIEVKGGLRDRYFCVSVCNQGIVLPEEEVDFVRNRGWRGETAKSVTPSGSGIGLWLVDHIMQAHRGRLVIVPTRPDRVTEIRLELPASKRA
jgi:signal transduction histidine kinase